MKFLLDTCVVSELVSKKPNNQVLEFIRSLDEEKTYMSVITIGEVKHGIDLLPDKRKKEKLLEWLTDDLLLRFRGKVINVDEQIMYCWATMTALLVKRGKPIPIMDSLIAATCKSNNLRLLTRNEKDFKNVDVDIINPWKHK